jgi:hypothetical protein
MEESEVLQFEEFGPSVSIDTQVLAGSHGEEKGADGEASKAFFPVSGGNGPHATEDRARNRLLRSARAIFSSIAPPLSR